MWDSVSQIEDITLEDGSDTNGDGEGDTDNKLDTGTEGELSDIGKLHLPMPVAAQKPDLKNA